MPRTYSVGCVPSKREGKAAALGGRHESIYSTAMDEVVYKIPRSAFWEPMLALMERWLQILQYTRARARSSSSATPGALF